MMRTLALVVMWWFIASGTFLALWIVVRMWCESAPERRPTDDELAALRRVMEQRRRVG